VRPAFAVLDDPARAALVVGLRAAQAALTPPT
jgi:hypothetical protein